MKNPWKIMTGLAVLCAAASMIAQAQVIIDEHFTAAEGYADGALNGPRSGNPASFTVNSSAPGTVLLSATEAFRSVTHETLLAINDRYTVGMDFSFNRASGDISDANNTLFEMLVSEGLANIKPLFPSLRSGNPLLQSLSPQNQLPSRIFLAVTSHEKPKF